MSRIPDEHVLFLSCSEIDVLNLMGTRREDAFHAPWFFAPAYGAAAPSVEWVQGIVHGKDIKTVAVLTHMDGDGDGCFAYKTAYACWHTNTPCPEASWIGSHLYHYSPFFHGVRLARQIAEMNLNLDIVTLVVDGDGHAHMVSSVQRGIGTTIRDSEWNTAFQTSFINGVPHINFTNATGAVRLFLAANAAQPATVPTAVPRVIVVTDKLTHPYTDPDFLPVAERLAHPDEAMILYSDPSDPTYVVPQIRMATTQYPGVRVHYFMQPQAAERIRVNLE